MDSPVRQGLIEVSPRTRFKLSDLIHILDAPRIPLIGDARRVKALRRSIKTLADWTVNHAEEAPRLPQEDVRAIAAAYRNLRKVFRHDPYAPNTPPGIPSDWSEAMDRWIQAEAGARTAGAPVAWVDQFAYPKLLGLYAVAYGKPAGKTPGGPAERFLGAFFERLSSDLAQHASTSPVLTARVREACAVPTVGALRRRIKITAPDTDWATRLVNEHERSLEEYDPPNHW